MNLMRCMSIGVWSRCCVQARHHASSAVQVTVPLTSRTVLSSYAGMLHTVLRCSLSISNSTLGGTLIDLWVEFRFGRGPVAHARRRRCSRVQRTRASSCQRRRCHRAPAPSTAQSGSTVAAREPSLDVNARACGRCCMRSRIGARGGGVGEGMQGAQSCQQACALASRDSALRGIDTAHGRCCAHRRVNVYRGAEGRKVQGTWARWRGGRRGARARMPLQKRSNASARGWCCAETCAGHWPMRQQKRRAR